MALAADRIVFYQQVLDMTRSQVADLDSEMERLLAMAKQRLEEMQSAKSAASQIYDGACRMLGIENDMRKADADERFEAA